MRRSAWQGAGVLFSFVHTRVAVLVRHWFEIGLTDGVLEHGARLELRLLEPQAHRGTEAAAHRFGSDPAGGRGGAGERRGTPPRGGGGAPPAGVLEPEITADPWAWATAQLSDLDAVAATAGLPPDAFGD